MSELHVSIVTPEGKKFDGPATSIVAPGMQGSFGVLASHAPLISGLERGIVKITVGDSINYFVMDRGIAEVHDNAVVLLVDRVETASSADDADEKLKALSASAA